MKGLIEIEIGSVLRVCSAAESKNIERRWIQVFGKNHLGLNTRSFKWHLFSGGGYPAEDANQAQRAYDAHLAVTYLVMPNDGGPVLMTDQRPTNLNFEDAYVFPKNLAWTMAFTHEEDWLGPYFAKHRNYAALERVNFAAVRRQTGKQEQMRIAKERGWM